jgi:hypothetical protein
VCTAFLKYIAATIRSADFENIHSVLKGIKYASGCHLKFLKRYFLAEKCEKTIDRNPEMVSNTSGYMSA